ncbi:MAG TPA: antibiotic biosynthesis monooxygenase family protein [Gemmataceae bacterium]|jgi:heme-degrading monooxygenase HmoA|nr:antibiotic biosynthesis monooxygenase family protein [Gemmataceae bacterium]
MLRATLYMKVKAGREADFEQAWRTIAEQARRAPGNLRQTLLRDPADPSSFVVTSDWESEEAFRRFERSPEQDALTAPLRELRESARMVVNPIVAHIEGGNKG